MNWAGLRGSSAKGFGRFSALTIPRVTVKRNPKGFPHARTVFPGIRLVESPQGTLGRLVALTLISARSANGSEPVNFCGRMRRSDIDLRMAVLQALKGLLMRM